MDNPGKRGPLHTSGSVPAGSSGTDSAPSGKSPLHTSGSVARKGSGAVSSAGVKSPLHTSGSVAARRSALDSSSGVRRSLHSSGSVAVQTALESGSSSTGARYWSGPEHSPDSVAEAGVRRSVLEELTIKTLYFSSPLSLRELVAQMRLPFSVVNELLRRLRSEQLCEFTGMTGNLPLIAITSQGRSRAVDAMAINHYSGPAPVSLEHYKQQVRDQSVRQLDVHESAVAEAFSHLVLEPELLEHLGTALNSGNAIFLYGPSGTGKTAIATALAQVMATDRVWIPYAVEVDGQVICVYDPDVHIRINDPSEHSADGRWVLCHRPTVLVGGELTLEMLDLQFNPITKFYSAPVQMKANNGVLIIDDFGRQRLRPEELLNRWVVPLDRKIDFLSLAGGRKVEIPFEPCVVFATNLSPSALADDAFLRRIQTKIKVGAVSEQQFHTIFQAVCSTQNLTCESHVIDELIDVISRQMKEPLRACQPRDLVNRICWKARYKKTEPCLDREGLLSAVGSYFVREDGKAKPEDA